MSRIVAFAPVARWSSTQRVEVGLAQRVAVECEERLAEVTRGEPDRTSGAEGLVLDLVLEREIAVRVAEMGADLGRQVAAGHDRAAHAMPAQVLERVGEQRPVDERQHVLAGSLGEGQESRSLPADQDDARQAHPAARPMPSTTKPAARSAPGSSMLRPSISTFVRIVPPTAAQSTSASCGHSVTTTRASAPTAASSGLSATVNPVQIAAVDDGIPDAYVGSLREQPAGEDEARRLAHVVGVRLEGEPEQDDGLAAQRPEVAVQLADHPALLELVDLDHRVQELEVVARICCQLLQGEGVFWKTTSAEANACPQEARADATVEADSLGDAHDVGARGLADVGDLVDEGDARHQGGVRRELDHLRRGHVTPDHGALDPGVQRRDGVAVLVTERPHDDPVGMEEVGDRSAFGGELGVRGVSDLRKAAVVQPPAYPQPRSDRHGALHYDNAAPLDRRQLVDHGPDGREVGIARVGRRRADCDIDEVGVSDRLGDVDGERQALGIPRDQLLESGLIDWNLTAPERRDPLGEDVTDDDRVAELSQAGPGDEADVAGAEDRDA